jgi:SnoaL-like domain
MLDSGELALWCSLNRVMADYWADVDENGGQEAHEFYLPDGLYAIGNNRFEGQERIQAFYARRRYGTVLTRHLVCNVRVHGDCRADGFWLADIPMRGGSNSDRLRRPRDRADFDSVAAKRRQLTRNI